MDLGEWRRLAGRDAVSDAPYGAALAGTPAWFTLDHLLLAVIDHWPATRLAKVCGRSDVAVAAVVRGALGRMEAEQRELAAGNQRVRAWIADDAKAGTREDLAIIRGGFHVDYSPALVWLGSADARRALQADAANLNKTSCPRFRAVLTSRNRHSAQARAAWISTGTAKVLPLRSMDRSCIVGAGAFGPPISWRGDVSAFPKMFGPPRANVLAGRHRSSVQDRAEAPSATMGMVGGLGSEFGVREFGTVTRSLLTTRYKVGGRLLTAAEVAERLYPPPVVRIELPSQPASPTVEQAAPKRSLLPAPARHVSADLSPGRYRWSFRSPTNSPVTMEADWTGELWKLGAREVPPDQLGGAIMVTAKAHTKKNLGFPRLSLT